MTDVQATLDGNAAAGALRAIFAFDPTRAIAHCAHCQASRPLAELRFFGSPKAMVLRCASCGEVNVRLLETGRSTNVDLTGALRIDICRPDDG